MRVIKTKASQFANLAVVARVPIIIRLDVLRILFKLERETKTRFRLVWFAQAAKFLEKFEITFQRRRVRCVYQQLFVVYSALLPANRYARKPSELLNPKRFEGLRTFRPPSGIARLFQV